MSYLFGAIFQLNAQGFLVPNGVIDKGLTGLGYEIDVSQTPDNSDYTGFFLDPNSASTFLFDPIVDEGVRTFLVSQNDPISLQPILSNNYTELLSPNNYTFNVGSFFYLGFYTGDTFPQNGIYSNPLFGWGEFYNNNGAIEMVDSALEYGGGGIYAGTQTIIPIPEPNVLGLLALGALLQAWRHWRNSYAVLKIWK